MSGVGYNEGHFGVSYEGEYTFTFDGTDITDISYTGYQILTASPITI